MKKISLVLLLAVASLTTFAQTTWVADPAHSQIKFDVTHTGISTVSGAFTDFEATIVAGKDDFSDAVFSFTAKTSSVNTGIEARDKHLRSADFFDVAQFPDLSFKSNSLVKISDGKYKLIGNLTLHGVTKPIELELWYRGVFSNPTNQKKVVGFRAVGDLKRSDFGFGSKFPEQMLSEIIHIVADGEFSVQ